MAQNFNNLSKELQRYKSALATGMEKACTAFEADTKLLTHVDTGALRRSWMHNMHLTDDGHAEGAVGSNLKYAPAEDDYHGNISVAIAENQDKYFKIIADSIKRA